MHFITNELHALVEIKKQLQIIGAKNLLSSIRKN